MDIPKGRTAFFPNTLGGDSPHLSLMSEGAFTSHEERVNGKKVRTRSESFKDHFSQPELFYRSLAVWKKEHVVGDYSFEIGKCKVKPKYRMLWLIIKSDNELASKVAKNLRLEIRKSIEQQINQAIGADEDISKHQPGIKKIYLEKSPALSQANTVFGSIIIGKIAVSAADELNIKDYDSMKNSLESDGPNTDLIASRGGTIKP